MAHLRALSAGHVTADRPCQCVTTCGELRPAAARCSRGGEARSRSARGRTNDAGRAHAGGRPGDGRQRELLDRRPRARSHGLRRAAGRHDLGSLRARSRQCDDQPELARSARRRAAPRRTSRRRGSGSRIRAGRRRDGGGCRSSISRARTWRRERLSRPHARSQTARASASTAAFASTSSTAWSASPPWRSVAAMRVGRVRFSALPTRCWRRSARRSRLTSAAALTNDLAVRGDTRRGR